MQGYEEIIKTQPELKGLKRYCNICGLRFSKFYSFSKVKKRECRCPVCKSLERHRHLYIHLLSIYPFLHEKKVLHFAPEQIIKDFFINSPAEYFDADLDPSKATYTADITNIPFEDNYFDYIVCVHVLEHIPDDIKAMRELYRVLNPKGVAILSVPLQKEFMEDLSITDPKERERLYGQDDHVRYYNFETFNKRLQSAGFETSQVSHAANFPPSLNAAKLGGSIFLAKKHSYR